MLECLSPLVDFERSDKADTRDPWRKKENKFAKLKKIHNFALRFYKSKTNSKMANKYPYIGHSIDHTTMYISNNQLVTPPHTHTSKSSSSLA